MPIMQAALDKDLEDYPVPEADYDLRIARTEEATSKGGEDMIVCTIAIEGQENASPFRHWLVFPSEDREEETKKLMWRNIKRFLTLFKCRYDPNRIDTEELARDLEGLTARALLKLEASEDDPETQFNRLVLPAVRTEGRGRAESGEDGGRESRRRTGSRR